MLPLSDAQIKSIAEDLQMGMITYINKETGEIKAIIDLEQCFDDTEIWEAELEEIQAIWKDYIAIEKMPSFEAFKIMERFAATVQDKRMQEHLAHILNRHKPFQHFKEAVETSACREAWFKFRDDEYIEWVKKHFIVK